MKNAGHTEGDVVADQGFCELLQGRHHMVFLAPGIEPGGGVVVNTDILRHYAAKIRLVPAFKTKDLSHSFIKPGVGGTNRV